MASMDTLLGAHVKLTTTAGQSVIGDVFAYDERSHTVVIVSQETQDRQHASLHMFKEAAIADLQVSSAALRRCQFPLQPEGFKRAVFGQEHN